MIKKLLLSLVFSGSFLALVAQNIVIHGRVKDDTDLGIPGVTVAIKGTRNGVQTDGEGNFQITIPSPSTVLVFSSVGYKRLEQDVNGRTNLVVILTTNAKQLNEVVTIGYGSKLKRSITGSISSVTNKELQNVPVPTLEGALSGKSPGVFIEQGNGKLGQAIKVNIRGASSLTANTQPLYVLDGLPITTDNLSNNGSATNPLADLDFNQIESVQILKDASAAAIYGSRASNGVILITTKKGKSGRTAINFSSYFGTSTPTHRREFLNNTQYLSYFRDAAKRGGDYDFANNLSGFTTMAQAEKAYDGYLEPNLLLFAAGDTTNYRKVNTNWQDYVFQNGSIQNYDLSIGGGNDRTSFYVDASYNDTKGIIIKNELNRFTLRVNLETKATDYLTVGANLQLTRNYQRRIDNDNAFSTPLQAIAETPFTPYIDPRTGLLSGSLPGEASDYPLYFNPLLNSANAYYNTTTYRNIGNLFLNLSLFQGLSFRSELGFDILNQSEDAYQGKLVFRNTGQPNGAGQNYATQVLNYNTNNFFQYNKKIGKSSVDAVLGTSYQNSLTTGNVATANQFPSDAYRKLVSAANFTAATSSQSQWAFISYFSRVNYGFDDKYLLSISGRVDGSSRFGTNHQYGFFPAGSVGWVISQENFLKNSDLVSLLKLRFSYGLTGNSEIGNFASRGLFTASSYAGTAGAYPSQLSNPNLTWETTRQADLGTDFGFFNGRLDGTIDFYQKETNNLLVNVNVPSTTGFLTQTKNLGKLENKGFELGLNFQVFSGPFKWTTGGNFSLNRNKVIDIQGQVIVGNSGVNRAVEGQPLGVFYTAEFAGADPANGDALYYTNTLKGDGTRDRSTTNNYNNAQLVPVGNPNPKYIFGYTNDFKFGGFNLNILIQGVHGNQIYNGGGQYMSSNASNYFDNQTIDQLNSWKKPGDITQVPEARLFNPNGYNPSSRYLSNGSYLRFKTVSFSYSLPKSILSKTKIQSLRFYITGQNLLTITPYKGWDPEVNSDINSDTISAGYDFYSAPQAKTIIFGLNLAL